MIILAGLIFSKTFKINLDGTDLYVKGDPSKISPLHLVSFDTADSFQFESDLEIPEKVYILLAKNPTMSWETSEDKKFVPLDFKEKTYAIGNEMMTECVQWDNRQKTFTMKLCDQYYRNQHFKIVAVNDAASGQGAIPAAHDDEELIEDLPSKRPMTSADIENSHKLEFEGEQLVKDIINSLQSLDKCLQRSGACGGYAEAMQLFGLTAKKSSYLKSTASSSYLASSKYSASAKAASASRSSSRSS